MRSIPETVAFDRRFSLAAADEVQPAGTCAIHVAEEPVGVLRSGTGWLRAGSPGGSG